MQDLIPWIVFIHVASAFAFAAAHGVSLFAAYRIRRERDPVRIGAMLDLSSYSLMAVFISLLVLLVSGIAAGWLLASFDSGWIWVSLGLLIGIAVLMTPLGAIYYTNIRRAIGQRSGLKKDDPDPVPVSADELAALLDTRRPEVLLLLGGGGFFVILWLMMFRPF